jgi:hypothetical protein
VMALFSLGATSWHMYPPWAAFSTELLGRWDNSWRVKAITLGVCLDDTATS